MEWNGMESANIMTSAVLLNARGKSFIKILKNRSIIVLLCMQVMQIYAQNSSVSDTKHINMCHKIVVSFTSLLIQWDVECITSFVLMCTLPFP
jgi:hypothetical protein